jgi:arylsulfatase A-like enzyme
MNKQIIFYGTILLASTSCKQQQSANNEKERNDKPNIVFIYADDLDFDQINISNYPREKYPCFTGAHLAGKISDYKIPEGWDPYHFMDDRIYTPNMDKLAKESAWFSNFYITSAMSTPSRYSLLTGKYASKSHALKKEYPANVPANVEWNQLMDGSEENIAKYMKKAGYYTGIVGKWHNGEPEEAMTTATYNKFKPDSLLLQQKMREGQEIGCRFLTEKIGFDYAGRVSFGNADHTGGHNLPWYTEAALGFLEKEHEKPFFLYFPLPVPHGYGGGSKFTVDLRLSPEGYLDKVPASQPPIDDVYRRIRENGCSDRSITFTWIDDCLGAVLKKLDELGIAENTIVVFTSDHQSRGKFSCYEGARVPFMIRWPGKVKQNIEIDDIWANIDILPTLMEVAGMDIPENIDGQSFLKRITGVQQPDYNRALLLETSYSKAVVKGNYKYIANRPPIEVIELMKADSIKHKNNLKRRIGWDGHENKAHIGLAGVRFNNNQYFKSYFDFDQLYNLENDVFEQSNLAQSEKEKLNEMKKELSILLKDCPNVFGEFKTK